MGHEDKAEVGYSDVFDQLAVKRGKDGFTDGSAMFHDVMAPKAQDRIALSAHEVVAAAVIGTVRMLVSVDFDNKPFFAAGEVSVVGFDRELSRELVAAKLAGF